MHRITCQLKSPKSHACSWAEELDKALKRAAKIMNELDVLHDASALAVLSSARVIGCTTTGAAKYKVRPFSCVVRGYSASRCWCWCWWRHG